MTLKQAIILYEEEMEYESQRLKRDTSLNNLTFAAAFGSKQAVRELNKFFGNEEEAEEI